jgi:hypothetical protein
VATLRDNICVLEILNSAREQELTILHKHVGCLEGKLSEEQLDANLGGRINYV